MNQWDISSMIYRSTAPDDMTMTCNVCEKTMIVTKDIPGRKQILHINIKAQHQYCLMMS